MSSIHPTQKEKFLLEEVTGGQPIDFASRTALTRSLPPGHRVTDILEEGTLLKKGRYRVERPLGSGGEGTVYQVYDFLRREYVAMKLLHHQDYTATPALKREFRVQQDLSHPNLVTLYELVVTRELSFFTMSFVAGVDFIQACKNGHSPFILALQLAEVLDFLHSTGRVHCDVKPKNILVSDDGKLTLLDFGITLQINHEQTGEHRLAGTPKYMAPEVAQLQTPSEKSDAFSLGVLLFEAWTGEHPEGGKRIQAHQKNHFDPQTLAPNLNPKIRELICGLTEPQPLQRWTMRQARELLEEISIRELNLEHPTSFSQRHGLINEAFMGREQDLARLSEAWKRQQESKAPALIQLEAASGLGKSALLNQFSRTADRALILRGKCSESEVVPHKAFDGIVDGLLSYLRQLDQELCHQLVSAAAADMASLLFPEFSSLPGYEPQAPLSAHPLEMRSLRNVAYLAIGEILAKIAERQPLILIIDDLQWGDSDSAKLIQGIFSATQPPQCLLILAHRPTTSDPSECVKALLGATSTLTQRLPCNYLPLLPLLERDSIAILDRLLERDNLSSEEKKIIYREAKGSPLLLTEIANHVRLQHEAWEQQSAAQKQEQFGLTIHEIVQARCLNLSSELADAFSFICCAGAELPLRVLAELVELPSEKIVSTLEDQRLTEQRKSGSALAPAHDAIRAAGLELCQDIAPRLHGRLAEALRQEKGEAAQIARHYHLSQQPEKCLAWAEQAAHQAIQGLAFDSAAHFFQMALNGLHSTHDAFFRLQRGLAESLASAGRGAIAAPIFSELAKNASTELRVQFSRAAAEHWLNSGQVRLGTTAIAEAQRQVGLRWAKTYNEALLYLLWERFRLRHAADAKLADLKNRPPPSEKIKNQLAACRAAWPLSAISHIRASANGSRYLRLALQGGKIEDLALGYGMEAMLLATEGNSTLGKQKKCRSLMKQLLQERPRDAYLNAYILDVDAQCEYFLGNLDGSLENFAAADAGFRAYGKNVTWELNGLRMFWADALFFLGRHREQRERILNWRKDAEDRGDYYASATTSSARSLAELMCGGGVAQSFEDIAAWKKSWQSPFIGYHDISFLVNESWINTYIGNDHAAAEAMKKSRPMMRKSFLNRCQVARVQVGSVECCARLNWAAGLGNNSERRRELKAMKKLGLSLIKEEVAWGQAFGYATLGTIELIERPRESALEKILLAAQIFDQLKMKSYAAACRARVGEQLGGEKGKELYSLAREVFEEEEHSDWLRSLDCHIPRSLASS
ncbi:MAG: protein kinase [Polyangiaceae bacterium]|nr:protein kinase [Polyangiaceae bacterium]